MKKKELSGKKRLHPLNNAENVLGPKSIQECLSQPLLEVKMETKMPVSRVESV